MRTTRPRQEAGRGEHEQLQGEDRGKEWEDPEGRQGHAGSDSVHLYAYMAAPFPPQPYA